MSGIYAEKLCLTPAGPCAEASGPDARSVAAMVIGTAAALWLVHEALKAQPRRKARRLR